MSQNDGVNAIKRPKVQRVGFLTAVFLVWTLGCTSNVGLPQSPLPIAADRYDNASLQIDNAVVGARIIVKRGSELTVGGQMTRRAAQTLERTTMGVAFQFRCDNSSVMKALEHNRQMLYIVSSSKDLAAYATESGGVISFRGRLRMPKQAGEYELYLSVVEAVTAPSGTEVSSALVPAMRIIMRVE